MSSVLDIMTSVLYTPDRGNQPQASPTALPHLDGRVYGERVRRLVVLRERPRPARAAPSRRADPDGARDLRGVPMHGRIS